MLSKAPCVLLVLWLCLAIAETTQANSANGVNTLFANTLNPTGIDTTQRRDERGLATFKETFSQSPTGLLYAPPFKPPEFGKINAWRYRGSLEGGFLLDDDGDTPENFIEYSDWSEGPLLNYFNLSAWREDNGYFLDLSGGGVDRKDQYYLAQGGQYGLFKLMGFFNEIPHVFETNAITLFEGVGSDQLLLPPGLIPGDNSTADIRTALESASRRSLDLSRAKGGLGFEITPSTRFRMYTRYTQENRTGGRPFGGTFLAPFYAAARQGGWWKQWNRLTTEPIIYSPVLIMDTISTN
ncbi:MtrB/PioB family outer membrane beta-barrel protein [Nitrosococcus oceani]|nr:MtrB/PioB family outer membrane beta-barrel protein [Nitrosococcus oceani]